MQTGRTPDKRTHGRTDALTDAQPENIMPLYVVLSQLPQLFAIWFIQLSGLRPWLHVK